MPQGASAHAHVCWGSAHGLGWGSHSAPHGLSWEIRELEGGAWEEEPAAPKSTHSSQNSRNVNLALDRIREGGSLLPSLSLRKQLLRAGAPVGQALGPSSRKPSAPTHSHS